jgi:hypothetical protein
LQNFQLELASLSFYRLLVPIIVSAVFQKRCAGVIHKFTDFSDESILKSVVVFFLKYFLQISQISTFKQKISCYMLKIPNFNVNIDVFY